MPEISRFLGIIIAMYYQEHNPPHFHVRYNKYRATITIKDLALLEGKLPPNLTFDDGISGDVDISKLVSFKGVFEPLKDRKFFYGSKS